MDLLGVRVRKIRLWFNFKIRNIVVIEFRGGLCFELGFYMFSIVMCVVVVVLVCSVVFVILFFYIVIYIIVFFLFGFVLLFVGIVGLLFLLIVCVWRRSNFVNKSGNSCLDLEGWEMDYLSLVCFLNWVF